MNKLILLTSVAAIVTFGVVSESWADCGTEVTGDGSVGTNAAGNKCGVCGTAGHESDCRWEIKDGVLTISKASGVNGNVSMADYSYTTPGISGDYTSTYSNTAPWSRLGATSVVVENGISNIGNDAFMGDTKITNVTGMENVTTIGNDAFWGASSLTSVDMPNVNAIETAAFASASSLTSVDIPNVTSLGASAFYQATSLTSVDMPNVTSIGNDAFNGNALEYIVMPDSDVTMGLRAFGYDGLSIMSSCGSSGGYKVCTNCNSNQVYQSGTGCASACNTNYMANEHGFCQKNPTQVAQNNQQQGGSGDTGGASTDGDISGDFNPADCYNKGQVPYDNQCWNEYPFARKRWTPAEAAEWLHDGNDNFVIITFKK